MAAKAMMASHLLRRAFGHLRPRPDSRRAKVRGRVNGQLMQNRLPASSKATITKPR